MQNFRRAAAVLFGCAGSACAQATGDFVWRTGVQGGDGGPWGVASSWWVVDGNGGFAPTKTPPNAVGAAAWISNLTNKKNQDDKRWVISLANANYTVGTLNLRQDDSEAVRIGSAANQAVRSLILDAGKDGQGKDKTAQVRVLSGTAHEFKTSLRLDTDAVIDTEVFTDGNGKKVPSRWTFLESDTLDGTISDAAKPGRTLTKKGGGLLRLLASSPSFDGPIIVEEGGLTVGSDKALGSNAGDTTVKGGGALAFMDLSPFGTTYSTNETIFLNGAGPDQLGAARVIRDDQNHISHYTFGGTLSLESDSALGAEKGCTLTLSGLVRDKAGAKTLSKVGPGTIVLESKNTFGGQFDIKTGSVVVKHNEALGAAGQTARSIIRNGASLVLDGKVVGESLDLEGGGTLASFGAAAATANIALAKSGDSNPILSPSINSRLDLSGIISDKDPKDPVAALRKTGKGTVALTNSNTYSGKTLVEDGILLFQGGSLSAGGGSVDVTGKGALAGYGNLNGRTVNGSAGIPLVKPQPPGNNFQGPDQLAIGALNLNAGAYIAVISGPLDNQIGQLGLGGPGDIHGATLRIELGYAPEQGDASTIIHNDSGQSILGMFEGVSFSSPNWPGGIKGAWFDGQLYRFGVSYAQPDLGRADVLLTTIPAPGVGGAMLAAAGFLLRTRRRP